MYSLCNIKHNENVYKYSIVLGLIALLWASVSIKQSTLSLMDIWLHCKCTKVRAWQGSFIITGKLAVNSQGHGHGPAVLARARGVGGGVTVAPPLSPAVYLLLFVSLSRHNVLGGSVAGSLVTKVWNCVCSGVTVVCYVWLATSATLAATTTDSGDGGWVNSVMGVLRWRERNNNRQADHTNNNKIPVVILDRQNMVRSLILFRDNKFELLCLTAAPEEIATHLNLYSRPTNSFNNIV